MSVKTKNFFLTLFPTNYIYPAQQEGHSDPDHTLVPYILTLVTTLKEINCTKLEYLIPTRTTLSPPDGALIVNPTTKIVAVQFPNNALHCKILI